MVNFPLLFPIVVLALLLCGQNIQLYSFVYLIIAYNNRIKHNTQYETMMTATSQILIKTFMKYQLQY